MLITVGSVVSVVCVRDVVVCISSSKQQLIQRACWRLNISAGGFDAVVSVVCIVSVISYDRCRLQVDRGKIIRKIVVDFWKTLGKPLLSYGV